MRPFTARALHILLACSVFLSTTGFVVDEHYCGSQLKSTAVFFKARGCTRANHAACRRGGHCTAHKNRAQKGCCHNKKSFHQLSQDQKTTNAADFSLKLPLAFAAILPAFSWSILIPEAPASAFLRYRPPLLFREDIQPLLQLFRL